MNIGIVQKYALAPRSYKLHSNAANGINLRKLRLMPFSFWTDRFWYHFRKTRCCKV